MPDHLTTDTQSARLLIIDDDRDVSSRLAELFSVEGYDVSRAADGASGMQEITTLPPYDVVLLDIDLPEKDGFEVLREARKAGVDSPVIVLTAHDEDEHKLRAFELGADDYVTKPFDTNELAARVQAVLNRSQSSTDDANGTYTFGDVHVDFDTHTAQRGNEQVEFTALEFDILEYLINHRGRTISRKQLLRDVWGISGDVTTRTIDRHVASLRKKIEPDPTDPQYIETVYGIGYKFAA